MATIELHIGYEGVDYLVLSLFQMLLKSSALELFTTRDLLNVSYLGATGSNRVIKFFSIIPYSSNPSKP
jgi:hypothetical protein